MTKEEAGIWGPSGRDGDLEGRIQRRKVGGGEEGTLIPEDLGSLKVIFSYLSLIWEIFRFGEAMFVYFWEWWAVWHLLVEGRGHRRMVN